MKRIFIFGWLAVFVAFIAIPAFATAPRRISFQGELTDNNGRVVNGTPQMRFWLYDAESAGNLLWGPENHAAVTVVDGVYNVELGSLAAINLAFDTGYWLAQEVGGELITPRRRLMTAPYAFYADTAANLVNGALAQGTLTVMDTLTVDGANLHVKAGEVRIQGSAVGALNMAAVTLYDVNGMRIGWMGDGAGGDSDVMIMSEYGRVHLVTTGGTRRLTVTANGLVGIDTQAPNNYKLTVNGSLGVNSATCDNIGGSAWGTLSDSRVKNVTGQYTFGLNEIIQLRPIRYRYKPGVEEGEGAEHIGFLAQEVQAIIPEAVSVRQDGYLRFQADPIFWAMVNAIKELKDQNEELLRRLTELEAR